MSHQNVDNVGKANSETRKFIKEFLRPSRWPFIAAYRNCRQHASMWDLHIHKGTGQHRRLIKLGIIA